MKANVYCKPTGNGLHTFFLRYEGEEYYLFRQKYRKGVQRFYSRGVDLNSAFRFALAHNDSAVLHTMEKLPVYISFIEREYGIVVLDRTKKKQRTPKREVA